MDLPSMITNFFERLLTGVLEPLRAGLQYILPTIEIIAVICLLVALFCVKNKGAIVVSLIIVIGVSIFLGDVQTFVATITDWFTGDSVSAPDAFSTPMPDQQKSLEDLAHN